MRSVLIVPGPVLRMLEETFQLTAVSPAACTCGVVKLTIPKGASSGQTLRLRGRGVAPAGAEAGDQLVELQIVVPPKIDDALAEFMQTWRQSHSYDPRRGMKA